MTHRRRPHTQFLFRVGGVGSIDVRLPRPAASHQSDHSHRVHVEITVLGQIGVGRSLSSVDNIGCLHHRLSDNPIGGIRLESDEQATSLTPTVLNLPTQTSHAFDARTLRGHRRQRLI